MTITRRHVLQAGAAGASLVAMGRFRVSEAEPAAGAGAYAGAWPALDSFAEQYMRDMNSPGMTLVLADREGVQRVANYGFGDLETRKPPAEDTLFEIGSISKSFVALALLQLRDEGRLDLNRPVVDYLPWLRIDSKFAPITTHHLLTHTSGLPGAGDVFQSDPELRHLAAYAPGEHFHYNNAMYDVLGILAWTLDGRELPELLRERILRPLGMTASEPVITADIRSRLAKSYQPFFVDRPYPRQGRLCEAPFVFATGGAGCVACTASDMGAYVRMLASGGKRGEARLVSEDGFGLFATPHVLAEDFGPGAHYGYGIAVDTLDGNRLLRHTGGMVSFMSALMVDIDEGFGGFASVNAQQGYRPNPVVRYAIQLMRARRKSAPPPPMPEADAAAVVKDAADFAGAYRGDAGALEIIADGERLFVLESGERVPLERLAEAGRFVARHPRLERFAFVFGRKDPEAPKSPVVEVSWGADWYRNARYEGPEKFDYPKAWDAYVGHYRNESPWIGSLRVLVHKGRLTLEGTIPLEADGELFRLRDGPYNTEWIRFGEVVNGRCMHMRLSGSDLWRVAAA
ncbi:MAG TPA: serine hydrolase domain-containing protein [Steroidobacteraceae bacterium]|nr:serine hydrolase domain-containing protein [Steroidobacteraceae bacterium]